MTVEEFIAKWQGTPGGAEKKNFPIFIGQLCELLGVEPPSEPAAGGVLGSYEYEAPVPKGSFRSLDASGAIDLYKRGCFIMEAKQSYLRPEQIGLDLGEDRGPRAPSGARYDKLMRDARHQAENYAKNLPAFEPVAPFLIVCDIGRAFEIYHDAAGNGRGYTFFPDKQRYRIELVDLNSDAKIKGVDQTPLEMLRSIWTRPKAIDPRFQSADVTRTVARRLASVSQYIEQAARLKSEAETEAEKNRDVEEAALFLMRLLFCMFAEDIGLLPENTFKDFLLRSESNDDLFEEGLADLWLKMGAENPPSRFAHALSKQVRYFNGGLFRDAARTYRLSSFTIHDLYEAARQNWRKVEPAIFGTLLEQALSPKERAKLGAHYTPRPYVETLVRATIMDVLNAEWTAIESGDRDSIRERAIAFHDRLASIRVLDPACGTGNFLYVSMELMQALEARVIETIQTLGGQAGPRVGPHQFYGLEKNPRAARIAELVLWIGWLRNRLQDDPDSVPEPVLAESANINFGLTGGYDAVLRSDHVGQPDTKNPAMPIWPEAEFIVGNPPFIGKGGLMRAHLGDAYVDALKVANPTVAASADFVMQWWDRAARILLEDGSQLVRFGFVTTNSITQEFNRRIVTQYLHNGDEGLSLIMAVPDHPWTKATADAASVRIAMTVVARGKFDGELLEVLREEDVASDDPIVKLSVTKGHINPDLTTGADVTTARPLRANAGLSCNGMMLAGQGFKLTEMQAKALAAEEGKDVSAVLRGYIGGSELLHRWKRQSVIDFYGLSEEIARTSYPVIYQHLLTTVKPEREKSRDKGFRERWWLFGRVRPELRSVIAGLPRYIATTETSKHRVFQFVDANVLPDHMVVAIGSDNAFHLGVLQSIFHLEWTLRTGGWLGFGNDNRYSKSKVFDPFPFPAATTKQHSEIAQLAEELDETRKRAIADTDKLTMTELYNLRAQLRSGVPFSEAEQRRATKARAGIVNRLHEQLDLAVADAYGWRKEWQSGDLGPSEIVSRLVRLNHQRAIEEDGGEVRWLRPDRQNRKALMQS